MKKLIVILSVILLFSATSVTYADQDGLPEELATIAERVYKLTSRKFFFSKATIYEIAVEHFGQDMVKFHIKDIEKPEYRTTVFGQCKRHVERYINCQLDGHPFSQFKETVSSGNYTYELRPPSLYFTPDVEKTGKYQIHVFFSWIKIRRL